MSGDLPPPHVLAALGTVLCLYPSQARHELAGWTRAVRAACDSRLDSDGLCESVQFYDRDGLCCWRLCVLPDTDLLAWEELVTGLPGQDATEPPLDIGQRLWKQLARTLRGQGWQANVVRLHAVPVEPGFSRRAMLATSLPRLSDVGADVARRWVREQGIECGALIDDCCCCRTMATQRAETGDQHRHDTRIRA